MSGKDIYRLTIRSHAGSGQFQKRLRFHRSRTATRRARPITAINAVCHFTNLTDLPGGLLKRDNHILEILEAEKFEQQNVSALSYLIEAERAILDGRPLPSRPEHWPGMDRKTRSAAQNDFETVVALHFKMTGKPMSRETAWLRYKEIGGKGNRELFRNDIYAKLPAKHRRKPGRPRIRGIG